MYEANTELQRFFGSRFMSPVSVTGLLTVYDSHILFSLGLLDPVNDIIKLIAFWQDTLGMSQEQLLQRESLPSNDKSADCINYFSRDCRLWPALFWCKIAEYEYPCLT